MNTPTALAKGFFDGLGVEDIAIREGIPVEALRAEVIKARDDGRLGWILMHARKKEKKERRA